MFILWVGRVQQGLISDPAIMRLYGRAALDSYHAVWQKGWGLQSNDPKIQQFVIGLEGYPDLKCSCFMTKNRKVVLAMRDQPSYGPYIPYWGLLTSKLRNRARFRLRRIVNAKATE